jgi:hypothetical protein
VRSPAHGSTPRRTQPRSRRRPRPSVSPRAMNEAEEGKHGPGEGESGGLNEFLVDHEGGDGPENESRIEPPPRTESPW